MTDIALRGRQFLLLLSEWIWTFWAERERALQSLSIYYRSQYRCVFGFLSLCCYVAWKWHSFNKTNEELVVVVVSGSTGMPLGGICIYENYWCPLTGRTSRDWMPECGFRWLRWRFRVGCCNKKAPAGITLWRYTVICFLAAECWPKHKMAHKRIMINDHVSLWLKQYHFSRYPFKA